MVARKLLAAACTAFVALASLAGCATGGPNREKPETEVTAPAEPPDAVVETQVDDTPTAAVEDDPSPSLPRSEDVCVIAPGEFDAITARSNWDTVMVNPENDTYYVDCEFYDSAQGWTAFGSTAYPYAVAFAHSDSPDTTVVTDPNTAYSLQCERQRSIDQEAVCEKSGDVGFVVSGGGTTAFIYPPGDYFYWVTMYVVKESPQTRAEMVQVVQLMAQRLQGVS